MSVGLIDKTKFNYLFLLNVCFFSAYFIGLFFANDNNSILQLDSLTGFFLEMYKCDDLFTLFINCIKVVSFELLLIILFSFFALFFFIIITSRGSRTRPCADGSAGPERPVSRPRPHREPCRLPR